MTFDPAPDDPQTSALNPENTPEPAAEAVPQPPPPPEPPAEIASEPDENFADILSDFERSHSHKPVAGARQLSGTVISISAEQVFLDIGYKTEGVLPRSAFDDNAAGVKAGDNVPVSVTGRNEEGYYELSRFRVAQPRDWTALQEAFDQKLAVVGTVTGVVKGGLHVDVGVRAFMPASRSGTRDAAELEKLVGTQINCRITKLDITDEDVVVDRRVVLEEQARADAQGRLAALKEGDTVPGTVRSLMAYGAFVDLGGVDGLLHVSDIAWNRVNKPEDVLSVGQEIQVRILKFDPETKKISLGLKQLEPEPWETVPARYQLGQRVAGTVTRLADFGAFVEIEPGVEGLIHISEMAWGKKVRHPSDLLKEGHPVDAVILGIKPEERRLSLGLKQTLSDPWVEVQQNFPVGAQIQGPVTRLMKFGAFVQISEGIEGLVHISEIVADRRLNHPSDVLRVGEIVKASVLAIDTEKRQVKLSMKQLIPTSIDEYIAEHKAGDTVSGRVVEESAGRAVIELGEGIRGACRSTASSATSEPNPAKSAPKADLSSLSSMLQARWKGSTPAPSAQPEPLRAGQVRSFKITSLDAESKRIDLELA
ncbi:MAG TPA: 30S ribosomal protein S1 [Terracidiphilus sp.]|jgi:small subunit ribosomal protein S1|nr:30S ribosomal protein S1 [Terracidiphilus sp.]